MSQNTHPNSSSDIQHSEDRFLVVGIGASAGGINALQEFFRNVPQDSGVAYVVILHLSPDFDSKLAEVLQTTSVIPVHRVKEKLKIEKDNVYVISPDSSLKIVDGHLLVTPISSIEERRAPVDIFFRTLAESHRERAVAVILSGTGANGSMGLKRIKENGGVSFVQNPRQAEFNEMPRNAIATELVDAILDAGDIPAKILAYKAGFSSIHISSDIPAEREDDQVALREIFTQLRVRTGHDFTNYKRPTMLRRLERRINVRNLPNLASYAKLLKDVPEEAQALLKDLLISVTNFFRDKHAFSLLENEIIPKLIEGKTAEHKIRVWVVGCATGEEAYSLAMMFAEKLHKLPDSPSVQIFATDIDEDALEIAREGVYSLNDAADVPPDRMRRFFSKEEYGYRVRREIREMILFANHNVIKDPPFSRLHLVTCRNMLIYLNQTAQLRVMETLHFGLNPGGYLFIGSSESIDGAGDLYVPVNKEHHIYQSRPVQARSIPVPEIMPTYKFERNQTIPSSQSDKKNFDRITYYELHQQLLEKYAPPSVVVNPDFDVVHISESAGKYLQMTGGEPSNNLLKLIKKDFRLELRSGLYQAVQRKANITLKNVKVKAEDHIEVLDVIIRPVLQESDPSRGFVLVIFEEVEHRVKDMETDPVIEPDSIAQQLEEELTRSKAQLRTSIEQYEVQAEELKASNEELQAMNEELRSSAEELETSKEELQSINEELTTVNQELKVKIEELSQSNNNFQNLINSIDIGTIFLDRSFRINLFTPAAKQIFSVIANDVGRPLSDISSRLVDINLLEDVEAVIDRLQTVEREVRTTDHRAYMMRISPYRTSDDRIKGAVVTFVDITARKTAEMDLQQSEANLRMVMDSISDVAIVTFKDNFEITGWNKGAQKIFGYTAEEAIGLNTHVLFTPEDVSALAPEKELEKVIKTGKAEDERWHIRKGGARFFASGIVNRMRDRSKGFVKIARDMTSSKLVEQHKDEFIGVASHELKTPVTSIKSYAEILREILSQSPEKEAFDISSKLDAQVDRLWILIKDLLDTTRISEGQLMFKPERVDIKNLIEECRANFEGISRTQHKIITSVKDNPVVDADRERILQVLTNLVSNAIKYSPNGGNIFVSAYSTGSFVVITIEDQGIGIPEESQKSIFQKFYRSSNPIVGTFPGIGLGLYITNEIVKRHGGTISVESREGKGSKFTVTLPTRGLQDKSDMPSKNE